MAADRHIDHQLQADLGEMARLARSSIMGVVASIDPGREAEIKGACLHTSYLLLLFLNRWMPQVAPVLRGGGDQKQGMLGTDGNWNGHYWVEIHVGPQRTPWIVDATADQFGWDPIAIAPRDTLAARYRAGDQGEVEDALQDLHHEITGQGFGALFAPGLATPSQGDLS